MLFQADNSYHLDEMAEDLLPGGVFSLSQAVHQRNIDMVRFLLDAKLFRAESFEFRHDALHRVFKIEDEEERAPYAKRFIETMTAEMGGVEEVANVLLETRCHLVDVVRMKDVDLTRAFLEKKSDVSEASIRVAVDQLDRENAYLLLQRDDKQRTYFLDRVFRSPFVNHGFCIAKTFIGSLMDWKVVRADTVAQLARVFETGNERVIEALLRYEIDVQVRELFGVNALANIFANEDVDAIALLKSKVFPVDMPSCKGQTPLHFAAKKSLPKNVEFLLSRGANPNVKDDDGNTPLFKTFGSYKTRVNTKIVKLLMQNEADLLVECKGWRNLVTMVVDLYERCCIGKVLLACAAVIHGEKVDESVKRLRDSSRKLTDYYEDCVLQLEGLKSDEVRNGLTMFSVVSWKAERLCVLVNDDARKVVKMFLDRRGKTLDSLYRTLVVKKLKKIRDLRILREKAVKFFAENVKAFGNNYYVVKEVVSYFSYADLIMLK